MGLMSISHVKQVRDFCRAFLLLSQKQSGDDIIINWLDLQMISREILWTFFSPVQETE